MKITISSESTIDLTPELLAEYNIKTIPFSILLGDKLGVDGEITPQEIFDFVDKNKVLPKTSAINEIQYKEYFEELLKDSDVVIHIGFSSGLSVSYENAVKASKQLNNVHVIDSKSLSTGIALLAIKASNMVKQGKSVEEIVLEVSQTASKVQASFVLKQLEYLKKGGRCSSLMYLGANLLQIRPQIVVKDGKMVSGKKYRLNFDICVKRYCEDTLQEFSNFDDSIAFVTYTTASDKAIETAYEALKNAGFKKIYKTTAGSTITSHCGPNTLGILFITK